MNDTTAIGTRLRAARRERGLTQDQLAERARLSPDMISRIERGDRRPSIPALHALAAALRISPSQLLGKRERLEGGGGDRGMLGVRDAIQAVTEIPGLALDPDGPPAAPDALAAACAQGWDLYWSGRLGLLAELLPSVIGAARAAERDHGAAACGPLAEALQMASGFCVHMGDDNLAHAAARNAMLAAERSGDPLRHAACAGSLAWALMHQGRLADAQRVAAAAAAGIEPRGRVPLPHLTVYGSLLLWAAAAAAGDGDADAVREHMSRARAAALPFAAGDRQDYQTNFGANQMAMQAAHQAAVLTRPDEALAAARRADPSALRLISRGALQLDVAQAHLDKGGLTKAAEALLSAHEISPEWSRHQSSFRMLAADVVRMSRRRGGVTERLAAAAGIG